MNVPASIVQQHDEVVRNEEEAAMAEPRASRPSPEHQLISIAEATAELSEETGPLWRAEARLL